MLCHTKHQRSFIKLNTSNYFILYFVNNPIFSSSNPYFVIYLSRFCINPNPSTIISLSFNTKNVFSTVQYFSFYWINSLSISECSILLCSPVINIHNAPFSFFTLRNYLHLLFLLPICPLSFMKSH